MSDPITEQYKIAMEEYLDVHLPDDQTIENWTIDTPSIGAVSIFFITNTGVRLLYTLSIFTLGSHDIDDIVAKYKLPKNLRDTEIGQIL